MFLIDTAEFVGDYAEGVVDSFEYIVKNPEDAFKTLVSDPLFWGSLAIVPIFSASFSWGFFDVNLGLRGLNVGPNLLELGRQGLSALTGKGLNFGLPTFDFSSQVFGFDFTRSVDVGTGGLSIVDPNFRLVDHTVPIAPDQEAVRRELEAQGFTVTRPPSSSLWAAFDPSALFHELKGDRRAVHHGVWYWQPSGMISPIDRWKADADSIFFNPLPTDTIGAAAQGEFDQAFAYAARDVTVGKAFKYGGQLFQKLPDGSLRAVGVRSVDISPSAFGRNPFAGKSAAEVDQLLNSREFRAVGPDPAAGRGSYFHPTTGRKYYLDPGGTPIRGGGTELPHVDVHRILNGDNLEKFKKCKKRGRESFS